MLRPFTLLLLCICTATTITTAPAQDESRLLGEFQKSVRSGRGKSLPVERSQELLATLDPLDSQKLAQVLVEAWMLADLEADALEQVRQTANAEILDIMKGQEASERRTFPQKDLKRFHELKAEVQEQRHTIEALRELQAAISERVQRVRSKEALLFFLQKVAGQRKYPLPIKLAALRAVGGGAADVMPEVATALSRAKDAEDLLALLDAMALAGDAARPHAAAVIALLQHKEEAVRERAALALAKIAMPEAIEPMITLLARSTGQTRVRVATALEVLTGQQFGVNLGSWRAWWESEGAAIRAGGGGDLGKGSPSRRSEADKAYYFGIPQGHSDAILYVIDCSGSMSKEIEMSLAGTFDERRAGSGSRGGDRGAGPGGGAAGPGAGGGGGGARGGAGAGGKDGGADGGRVTRLEACKKELIRALGELRPDQTFALLWYNDMPHLWEPSMQKATKEAVARAQAFVATLTPASSTNIYDSLQTGFGLVGRGARDKYYGVELDTIFLLTDGSPTLPDGKMDSTEKIILAVRQWNPLQRVTIHTIGIGGELNAPFLQQLANENGGEFKHY